jgi:hydrogenase nickel incorporation protein HypA/HybF
MHEMAITQSMVNLVLEEARKGGAHRVKTINLVLGELSGVVGDCVQLYFDLMSKDTIAEGATISFRTVAAQARCRECAKVFNVKDVEWICPECHSVGVDLVAGNELFVESIEVE